MALSIAFLTVEGTGLLAARSVPSAGASAVCQSDGSAGCTATLPCPEGQTACPTIDVNPANDLSDGQYVFVTATNFPYGPDGETMRLAICSLASSPTDPSCLNGTWESQDWTPIQVPIADSPSTANKTEASLPAFYDQAGVGDNPLPSHDVQNLHGVGSGFYCDASHPCAMEITEEEGTGNDVGNGPADSSSNTVVVPITFAEETTGCPSTDPTITTFSSTSIEHFLPAAVDSTCSTSTGVIAQDTTADNESVVTQFTSGNAQVAFIDNPGDIGQESTLLGGRSYAYIPVAVSATAVGMLAGEQVGATPFPLPTYNLTPNMVAGIITSAYNSPTGLLSGKTFVDADNLVSALAAAGVPCSNIVGCAGKRKSQQLNNELNVNAFNLLNPTSNGVLGVTEIGSYMSNVDNGASYQATNWFCSSPDVSYTVDVDEVDPPAGQSNPVPVTITDPNVASTTLVTPPDGSSLWPPLTDPSEPWVFPSCTATSTFPALASPPTQNGTPPYSEAESPSLQAKNIRGWAYGGGSLPQFHTSNQPDAGFGLMDSSEASYYGLNTASLENEAGNFVQPTPASIEDGLARITACPIADLTCPVGTYQIDYSACPKSDATCAAAYPMPDITYAMVPTSPEPAATASAIKNLLTNLVNYSHSGGSVALPAGYAALPNDLYATAMADISTDITAEPAANSTKSSGSTGGTTTGSTSTSSPSSGSEPSIGSSDVGSSSDLSSGLPLSSGSSVQSGSSSPTSNSSSPNSGGSSAPVATAVPGGIAFVSLDAFNRYLLPVLVVLAIACLIAGPLLLLVPELRRRRLGRRAS